MRRWGIVVVAAALGSCGGSVDASGPRIQIEYARVVDEGPFVRALVAGRVTGERDGGTFVWTVGVMPRDRSVCREARGWRMDHESGAVVVAPGEARDFRIRATSGVRATCIEPTFARVARCGEPVTIVLAAEDHDETSGTYETTFDCAIAALSP